jgi:hypothetical protein
MELNLIFKLEFKVLEFEKCIRTKSKDLKFKKLGFKLPPKELLKYFKCQNQDWWSFLEKHIA